MALHCVFGDEEVISCYSSTSASEQAASTPGTQPCQFAANVHYIYGDAEVLSCYSSDTTSEQAERKNATTFPPSVRETLRDVVRRDLSGSSSNSTPRGDAAASTHSWNHFAPPGTVEDLSVARSTISGNAVPSGDVNTLPSGEVDGDGSSQATQAEKHLAGTCNPCLFEHTRQGCRNGNACSFCHLQHVKKGRSRPCKATRIQCKQIADMLESQVSDPLQRESFKEILSASSPYMRLLLAKAEAEGQVGTGDGENEAEDNNNGGDPASSSTDPWNGGDNNGGDPASSSTEPWNGGV